jgi:hypothetical protein
MQKSGTHSLDGTLQELLNGVAASLESGAGVRPEVMVLLDAAERSLDPAQCAANLESWLTSHGIPSGVPDLSRVIDSDKDGVANATDPDDDGDGVLDTDDCAPLDPGRSTTLADGRCVSDTADDDGDGVPDPQDCSPRDAADRRSSGCAHWYWRFDQSMTWHQARDFCQGLGGYLATFTSEAEKAFVVHRWGTSSRFWLGASDETDEGGWRWVTGEPFDWTDWDAGEPNNCAAVENYLMVWGAEDVREGRWNDLGVGASNPGAVPGACACADCTGAFYAMATMCEWDARPDDADGDGVPDAPASTR